MPSSYSTNLKIELQATGENSGTWGTITNTNLGTALEQAIVGYGNPSYASDANLTLTYTDTNAAQAARALVLNVTSAVSLSATRELVVPTIQKQYIVQNNTSGSQSITVKTSAGTGITVPNGRKAHLYVDGTNVIYMDDYVDINGGAIDGTPIGANSASTGAFTTLSASGNITVSGGTANGVLYLNGSKVATSGSAVTYDGTTFGTTGAANFATSSGNVGVGVTPSAWGTTNLKALQVGTSAFWNQTNTDNLYLSSNNYYDGTNYKYIISDFAAEYSMTNGRHIWSTAASGTAGNNVTFTEVMRITAGGDVGIGTSSPASRLNVLGSTDCAFFSAGSASYFALGLSTANGNRMYLTTVGASDESLKFVNAGGSELMRLTASGNLGLGVTPSAWGSTYKMFQASSQASFGGNSSNITIVGSNYYNDGVSKYIGTGLAALYLQDAGVHKWLTAPSGTAGNTITFTQAMTLDASGNLGVGLTSPGRRLSISATSPHIQLCNSTTGTSAGDGFELAVANSDAYIIQRENSPMLFYTNDTERARITAAGDVGIGTGSPSTILHVQKGNGSIRLDNGDGNYSTWQQTGSDTRFATQSAIPLIFFTNASERARITSGGEFLVGKTSTSVTDVGTFITSDGRVIATTGDQDCMVCNRQNSDGTLMEFRQANTTEGSISVSGNTVSYNAFAGSHWSQLQDGSKPDILRGTVMESINELCEWPGEQNERLPKAKISDTAGSKKVYGVFMAWDNDWTETNDMYVTAVGAFICRVNGSVTVQEGDLLESNGDGTARVQADDIIRSSTIGKVTSTVKTHQYDDGSYCVPTVLYCG